MEVVFEALAFGVKSTIWLFMSLFRGIGDTIRWIEARQRGDYYPFPVLAVVWFIVAIAILLCFCGAIITSGR